MKRGIPLPILLLCLLLPAGLLGCQGAPSASRSVTVPANMDRFLMVSFRDIAEEVGHDQGVRSPLSGQVFVTGEVAGEAEDYLTSLAMDRLRERVSIKLISPDRLRDLRPASSRAEVAELDLLREIGRSLEADGVFAGYVFRYRNRVGGNYSVTEPASVAFDIVLLRVSDGRVIWSRFFDETQKSLTEDLFGLGAFLERDGQWITTDRMARVAMDELMESLRIP